MGWFDFVLLIGIGLFFGYGLWIYNEFIKLGNKVKEAFATMDVYLKKRWDLVPNLVEVVKAYAAHEKSTLESVISIRNEVYEQMTVEDKITSDVELSTGIAKLMLLAESYPDLKANQNFLDLSANLAKIEDEIANSRKYFNAVVRMMNNKVEMFPSNIFASIFRYRTIKMFEADASQRENVQVDL